MKSKLKRLTVSILAAITLIGSIGVSNPSDASTTVVAHGVKTNTPIQILYKGKWYTTSSALSCDCFKVTSYSKDKKYAYGYLYEYRVNCYDYPKYVPKVNSHTMKIRILAKYLTKTRTIQSYNIEFDTYISKDSVYYKNSKKVKIYRNDKNVPRPYVQQFAKDNGKYRRVRSMKVLGTKLESIYFPFGGEFKSKYNKVKYYRYFGTYRYCNSTNYNDF